MLLLLNDTFSPPYAHFPSLIIYGFIPLSYKLRPLVKLHILNVYLSPFFSPQTLKLNQEQCPFVLESTRINRSYDI